jgi:type IV secretion system protein VirB8
LLESYFSQIESFEGDKLKSAIRLRNAAFAAAGVCVGALGLMAYALASLAPLKSVEPMVFVVDRATGVVERNTDLDGEPISTAGAINAHFAEEYVRSRQTYIADGLDELNRKVAALSGPDEYRRYVEWTRARTQHYSGTSKASVRVKVKSRSLLTDPASQDKRGIYQVRFDSAEMKPGEDSSQFWGADGGCIGRVHPACRSAVATIHFEWSHEALPESVRGRNPLGWIVTSYDVSEDAR